MPGQPWSQSNQPYPQAHSLASVCTPFCYLVFLCLILLLHKTCIAHVHPKIVVMLAYWIWESFIRDLCVMCTISPTNHAPETAQVDLFLCNCLFTGQWKAHVIPLQTATGTARKSYTELKGSAKKNTCSTALLPASFSASRSIRSHELCRYEWTAHENAHYRVVLENKIFSKLFVWP